MLERGKSLLFLGPGLHIEDLEQLRLWRLVCNGQYIPSAEIPRQGRSTRRPWCCPVLETKQKLTGEQDFMVSMVPMLCASAAIAAVHPEVAMLHNPVALLQSDLGHAVLLAGLAYAIGYLSLLKAWESVPSTVIVPCLQLSSPLVEIMEALLAQHYAAHPVLAPLRGVSLSGRTCVAFL